MSSFTPFVAPQWSLSPSLPLERAECYKVLFHYMVFHMACTGARYEMIGVMEYAPYSSGAYHTTNVVDTLKGKDLPEILAIGIFEILIK